jgi:hypothetical protein
MGFFGRFGGTDTAIAYKNIQEVPARLKLIRIISSWENLNHIPTNQRIWNKDFLVYQSTASYADMGIIETTNPLNKRIYAVVLEEGYGIKTFGKDVLKIYETNDFFEPTTETLDYSIIEEEIYLSTGAYILETTQDNLPIQKETLNSPQTFIAPVIVEETRTFNSTNDLKNSLIDTFIKIITSTGDFFTNIKR